MRTYSRADFEAARKAWADFSDEWEPYRKLAADRGMLYPPNGSALDSWSDAEPSQRALLVRAIRETPRLLRQTIATSRSWSQVIGKLNRQRDDWRELDDLETEYVRRERKADEPTPRGSLMSIGSILRQMRDSL